jgi:hypothetical protein
MTTHARLRRGVKHAGAAALVVGGNLLVHQLRQFEQVFVDRTGGAAVRFAGRHEVFQRAGQALQLGDGAVFVGVKRVVSAVRAAG